MKVELHLAVDVVDPISRLLVIRVDVCKPPNAATRSMLEVLAMFVKQREILLHITCQLG